MSMSAAVEIPGAQPAPVLRDAAPRKPVVRMDFDRTNPEAVSWARSRSSTLITNIMEETRDHIRAIISRAFTEGIPPRQAAKLIRSHIGLTQPQSTALLNFFERLRSAAPGDVVTAGTLKFRIPDKGLSDDFAGRAIQRYADRLIKQRAEVIARTEIIAASNEGQRQLWLQAIGDGLLTGDESRVWIWAPLEMKNGKLCEICQAMDGQTTTLYDPFKLPDGSTVMGPPAHPNCRCAVGVRPPSVKSKRASKPVSPEIKKYHTRKPHYRVGAGVVEFASEFRVCVIRRCGDDWCLYTHDGSKLLGRHDSREKAEAQEAAINIAKHARGAEANYDESKHPRDEKGQWTDKDGAPDATPAPVSDAAPLVPILDDPSKPYSVSNPRLYRDPSNPDNVLIFHATHAAVKIWREGIHPRVAGVINKDSAARVFTSSNPHEAVWKTKQEDDLKRERGVPVPRGDLMVVIASVPRADIDIHPRSGDLRVHRTVSPDEMVAVFPNALTDRFHVSNDDTFSRMPVFYKADRANVVRHFTNVQARRGLEGWDESKHPRDEDGQWTDAGGAGDVSRDSGSDDAVFTWADPGVASHVEDAQVAVQRRIQEIADSGGDSPDNVEYAALAHIDTALDAALNTPLSQRKFVRASFVFNKDGSIAAAGWAKMSPDRKKAEIVNVGSTKLGAGHVIVKSLISQLKSVGVREIELTSTARRTYERLGFKSISDSGRMRLKVAEEYDYGLRDARYDPDQARVPAGQPGGGQWTEYSNMPGAAGREGAGALMSAMADGDDPDVRRSMKHSVCVALSERAKRVLADRGGDSSKITYDVARDFVNAWAVTSGDSQEECIAAQIAVREELGPELGMAPDDATMEHFGRLAKGEYITRADAEAFRDRKMAEARQYYADHGDVLRALVRAEYDETQEFLSNLGIERVTIERGLRAVPPGVQADGPRDTMVGLRQMPASSWTTDPAVATSFAAPKSPFDDYDERGLPRMSVLLMTVPRRFIISTPRTGRGCLAEREVIVAAGRHKARLMMPVSAADYGTGNFAVRVVAAAEGLKPNVDD